MLELLFLFALIAWAVITAFEFLASLPAGPAILPALLIVPVLAAVRANSIARARRLGFLHRRGRPLPPDRFFWPSTRRHLLRRAVLAAPVAAFMWALVLLRPQRLGPDAGSLAAWLAALVGTVAAAEALAAAAVHLRASQRFDPLAPGFVGLLRRGLYRLSDNHEFLGEEPLPREKRRRESVY
jgi:hypothetical protein